jgi:flagellar biosynthesis protein FlhG
MAVILSIASGKGGAGKSMVTSNLGLLLAKRGYRVTLVDLDTGGANLHVLFGHFHPKATLTDFLNRKVKTLQEVAEPLSVHQNLSLISGTGETLLTSNLPHPKKKRLLNHLRKLDSDLVLVDVGAGTHFHTLDFFLFANGYLTVATPDPTSVLDLYRFIKLAAIRRVLSAFLARDPIATALSNQEFQSIQEVLNAVGQTNEAGTAIARTALESFQPCLILNRMGIASKVNTLHLQQMVQQYIGTELHVLGQIPQDEAVERSIRQYLPVVDNNPISPAAQAFEAITDSLEVWMESKLSPVEEW